MGKPRELHLKDWNDMVHAFHSESDRSAAVLAGGFVEHILGSYLQAIAKVSSIASELFSATGRFQASASALQSRTHLGSSTSSITMISRVFGTYEITLRITRSRPRSRPKGFQSLHKGSRRLPTILA
jgi:hypothetical protein